MISNHCIQRSRQIEPPIMQTLGPFDAGCGSGFAQKHSACRTAWWTDINPVADQHTNKDMQPTKSRGNRTIYSDFFRVHAVRTSSPGFNSSAPATFLKTLAHDVAWELCLKLTGDALQAYNQCFTPYVAYCFLPGPDTGRLTASCDFSQRLFVAMRCLNLRYE
jgi:hypothetical protein